MAGPGPRRQAREAALQVLFAADASQHIEPEAVEAVFDDVLREFSLPARAKERARVLVQGVAANLKAIDETLAVGSANWKVHRLASVDRNLLRIATWELAFEAETPSEVVIDEALEIAHRFAGDASARFVNGVLDEISKRREQKGES